uniref:Uncharacterized protein n=1 Tax=Aegilops tauschii subsp. strangulata TaxID=200361 RepID=A0A453GCP3_AEGTS
SCVWLRSAVPVRGISSKAVEFQAEEGFDRQLRCPPPGGLKSWPPASPRRCCRPPASMMSSLPLVDPPR